MIQYIYVLKCPNCEDEFFDFFEEAKACALGCLSNKPIITQTEVDRNDFGECTNHCDLGTVWSWEDVVGKETDAEPTMSVFNKGDLRQYAGGVDPEFDSIDNSVDFEIDETADNLNEFIDSRGNKISINANRVAATPQQQGSVPQNSAISLAQLAPQLGMFDTNVSLNFGSKMVKIPFSKEKMAYGDSFVYKDIFTRNSSAVIKEIYNKTGIRLSREYGGNIIIWTYNDDNNILLIHIPGFNFIIYKNDFIDQLNGQVNNGSNSTNESCSRKPIPEGMTIEQLVEEMEENEDTVECTSCQDLFDKSTCRKELNLGWLCRRCADDLVARGEGPVFKEDNYWDFLDEELRPKTWICEFDGHEIGTVEASTEEEAYEAMEREYPEYHYGLYDGVAIVYPADEDELDENVKEIHDLGSTYDGGYPDETPEVSDSHLKLCPECGKETFDIETGICVECGFN
jgi:hypothetical protein